MFARSTTKLGRSTKYDCREVRQSGRRHHRVCLCVSSARTSCSASSPSMTVHLVGGGLYARGERASSSSSASSAYFTCPRSASTSSSIYSSRRSTSFRTSACSDSKKHRRADSTRLEEEPLPKAEEFLLEIVRTIIPSVHEAPFMQCTTFSGSTRRDPISDMTFASPQLWTSVAESMWTDSTEYLVCVKRLDETETSVPLEDQLSNIASINPDLASTPSSHRPRASSSLYYTGPSPLFNNLSSSRSPIVEDNPLVQPVITPLNGKVGDCCDEDSEAQSPCCDEHSEAQSPCCNEHSEAENALLGNPSCCGGADHDVTLPPLTLADDKRFGKRATVFPVAEIFPEISYTSGTRTRLPARLYHDDRFDKRAAAPCSSSRRNTTTTTGTYGLVVQCRSMTAVSGCYILTTCNNSLPCGECSCTRFTLNRAQTLGASVPQQLLDVWLS
mmetsp:Transcript_20227/g.33913  ORF Transcript_20227/g.33913 Transcript_20227/m.33913 type:complete len:444 (-) Transcript_20227:230-1561(-)|eukprot:CAMPEP_0198199010 /NCGR_PEP_ID=MMETSP1445-20131203/2354_1 /TAXON_ID=36898 /ORGANISM="Pyramimonas sp., Strain CCMP2087" /LENGTH=443 /DNA_ID=CAMNT_0043868711 /DNA_START=475 /DNA_END=1806 /DNA_ORIENTATION=+